METNSPAAYCKPEPSSSYAGAVKKEPVIDNDWDKAPSGKTKPKQYRDPQPTTMTRPELDALTELAARSGMHEETLIDTKSHIMDGNFNAQKLHGVFGNSSLVTKPTKDLFRAFCEIATEHIQRERKWQLSDAVSGRNYAKAYAEEPKKQNSAVKGTGRGKGKGGKGRGSKGKGKGGGAGNWQESW